MPFFSVILPTYNRASFLARSIGSVIKQELSDWELIVIDDGSTDSTKDVVTSFKEARIKYVYQKNSERSAARNKGIVHASGTWICFLDSDDEFLPNHLKQLAAFIENNAAIACMVATGLAIHREHEIKHKAFLQLKKNVIVEIGNNFLVPTQVCVHRSMLENEQFDERFRLWEDTHLWFRVAARYPVFQMEEYTVIQHVHDEGTVVQGMKKIRFMEVLQYVDAIKDLRDQHKALFEEKLPQNYFNHYIDAKFRMYLYQARQNQQLGVATQIWTKAWKHRSSRYLIMELPKILLNCLNIGLHAR
ncbi:MAG: glycosyltransferase family 2 protein [Bacteroidetes bacterium]|nr:glycosyltransferase family 2 protein [Bacteroidota bacterium]MBM3423860.1 glycosyltransferase family 2 protein [Bacteroidota bacterium]